MSFFSFPHVPLCVGTQRAQDDVLIEIHSLGELAVHGNQDPELVVEWRWAEEKKPLAYRQYMNVIFVH